MKSFEVELFGDHRPFHVQDELTHFNLGDASDADATARLLAVVPGTAGVVLSGEARRERHGGPIMRAIAAISCLGLALSSCATINRGSTQTMTVATVPEVNAECILSNREGRWTVGSPGTVLVIRSEDSLRVNCSKAGYDEGTISVSSRRDVRGSSSWYAVSNDPSWLDVPSLLVDNASGAFDVYPESINIPMIKKTAPTS